MRNLLEGVGQATVVTVAAALVMLVLGLVALIRCPSEKIPEVIKSFGASATVAVALVVLVLGLVALIRCPPGEIPEVIKAFGAWLHVEVRG